MPMEHTGQTPSSRRAVLGAGLAVAGSGLLAACSGSGGDSGRPDRGSQGAGPGGTAAPDRGHDERDGTRKGEGGGKRSRQLTFTARPSTVDLGGGRTFKTWTYDDELPGRMVRITAGDTLSLTLKNHLPEATTVHWHGIALRNDMDGVPFVTQPPIEPGESFSYRYEVPHPGTYWFHPHQGVQVDRGTYAPLIVDDPREPLAYDREWVIMLDDWIDGVDGSTPDDVFFQLSKGKKMVHDPGYGHHGGGGREGNRSGSGSGSAAGSGPGAKPSGAVGAGGGGARPADDPKNDDPSARRHPRGPRRVMRGAHSSLLGHAGDVAYPYYLINGRTPDFPTQFKAKPGDRIRLRIINAGGETAFRVALGGHRFTVTHTDGFPVRPYKTDALLMGMGERYDVLITAKDGVFPLTALAEGKHGSAMAVLRTSGGRTPGPRTRPRELYRDVLASAAKLHPDESVALPRRRKPDRLIKLKLTGGMEKYDWAFDNRPYDPDTIHRIEYGERVRLVVINVTDMWHPVHLHGHTFALADILSHGARKDTAAVLPHHKLVLDFDADNAGAWMLHCHNIYHAESGMMTTVAYRDRRSRGRR
ncbi:multicopper oxidase family protein [Streptomyces sp. SCSIO 30461]|uniref:multicopper oxidase family protein n=1 Tax=Streptomyces sp. SCSIO 30461 TaxID=3118085 RepID=UPI0030CDB090